MGPGIRALSVAQSDRLRVHHVTEMFWIWIQTLGAKKQRVVG